MNIMGEVKLSADQVIDTCIGVPRREEIVKNDTAKNSYWQPVSHSKAVESVYRGLERAGLTVINSAFALNKTGHLLVGALGVQNYDLLPKTPGNVSGVYEIVLRHANDMSVALQCSAGFSVSACTNMSIFTGSRLASRKHTKGFEIDAWVDGELVPAFLESCRDMDSSVQTLRETPCSSPRAHHAILEAGNRGLVPLARMNDLYQEWTNPTFGDEFGSHSAWKLYNDFTYVAQKCSPARHQQIVENTLDHVLEFCAN